MSERERWIVYPLLFLALGVALRDKLFDQTQSQRVVCETLLVVDEGSLAGDSKVVAAVGSEDMRGQRADPGGHLSVETIHAGTVFADRVQARNLPTASTLSVPANVLVEQIIRALGIAPDALRGALPRAPAPAPDRPPSAEEPAQP